MEFLWEIYWQIQFILTSNLRTNDSPRGSNFSDDLRICEDKFFDGVGIRIQQTSERPFFMTSLGSQHRGKCNLMIGLQLINDFPVAGKFSWKRVFVLFNELSTTNCEETAEPVNWMTGYGRSKKSLKRFTFTYWTYFNSIFSPQC